MMNQTKDNDELTFFLIWSRLGSLGGAFDVTQARTAGQTGPKLARDGGQWEGFLRDENPSTRRGGSKKSLWRDQIPPSGITSRSKGLVPLILVLISPENT